MIRDARAGMWTEIALFALASVLLGQMGLGIFLFLIPLQVLYARRGDAGLLVSTVLVAAAMAAIRIIGAAARGALAQGAGLIVVELTAVGVLLIGLLLVNALATRPLPVLGLRLRAVPRLLTVTAIGAALCVPTVLLLRSRAEMGGAVGAIFRDSAQAIAGLISQGTKGLPGSVGIDAETLATRMEQVALAIFPRSIMVYYFATLTFSWWAGTRSVARAMRLAPRRLVTFALSERYVWPLIASMALVLADVAFDIGVVGYIAWNAGLIMLLLYGLQGLAIVQHAFARFGVGRLLRLLAYVALGVMLISPGASLVVVIGLPALGVSEIWLRYRTRRRNTDADEDHP
jgi:hypothetical protein